MFTLLRHQYPAVTHILTHTVNFAFRPNSDFENKEGARAVLGFQSEARLQLWIIETFYIHMGFV